MPDYLYRCPVCEWSGEKKHPMNEVDRPQHCPSCGAQVRRRFTPIGHSWAKGPISLDSGFSGSAQAQLLDPEFQAQTRDKVARMKEGVYERGDFK